MVWAVYEEALKKLRVLEDCAETETAHLLSHLTRSSIIMSCFIMLCDLSLYSSCTRTHPFPSHPIIPHLHPHSCLRTSSRAGCLDYFSNTSISRPSGEIVRVFFQWYQFLIFIYITRENIDT